MTKDLFQVFNNIFPFCRNKISIICENVNNNNTQLNFLFLKNLVKGNFWKLEVVEIIVKHWYFIILTSFFYV